MSSLFIGVTGMGVNQSLMDLLGQNLTNASNPAYHRQDAILAELTFGASPGSGVKISEVRRLVSNALDAAINGNASALSSTTQQLQALQQIQSVLNPSGNANALTAQIETFFNDAQQLTSTPADPTQRLVLLNDAQTLTDTLNGTAGQLAQTSADLTQQAQQLVDQVNQLAVRIADFNGQIKTAVGMGVSPNALEDQRDELIGQLSQLVDVRALPQSDGQTNVLIDGAGLVMTSQATPIQFSIDANNRIALTQKGPTAQLNITGGSLAAVMTLRNQLVPQYQSQFNTFTTALMQSLDALQARGLGLSGPLTSVVGTRAATSTTVPLAKSGFAFPPQAGTLDISVTDQATGQRTAYRVNIDPSTQSLQDVAAAISAVPHLQAVVDPQAKTLTILAQQGFAFDFAGRLSSMPDAQTITGTATPQVSGNYTGTASDTFTYTVTGSGQVGVSSNLNFEVRNAAGTLLNTFNIGQGYQPGAALGTVDGVTITMSAGTLNAGDSFSVTVTANPDTAGILPALGLNTFFSGSGASDVQVRSDLLSVPDELGLSATGATGDGTNLQRLIALRDQPVVGGTQTLTQYLASLGSDVATRISDLTAQQSAQQTVSQSLQAQQQSVSGVDPNEELVKLLQYQQGFQMSAHYISVVGQAMDYLLNIVT